MAVNAEKTMRGRGAREEITESVADERRHRAPLSQAAARHHSDPAATTVFDMCTSGRLQLRVNDELGLEAGTSQAAQQPNRPALIIRPPATTRSQVWASAQVPDAPPWLEAARSGCFCSMPGVMPDTTGQADDSIKPWPRIIIDIR